MIETIVAGILMVAGGLLLASFVGFAIYLVVGFFLVKKAMKEAPKALENINKALDEIHKELDKEEDAFCRCKMEALIKDSLEKRL